MDHPKFSKEEIDAVIEILKAESYHNYLRGITSVYGDRVTLEELAILWLENNSR